MPPKRGQKKPGETDEFCEECQAKNPGGMIECERCDRWLCQPCSALDIPTFNFLDGKKPNNIIHWYCVPCTKPAVQAVRSDKLIETKCLEYCTGFRNELRAEMDKKWDDLNSKINTNKESLVQQETQTKQSIENLRTEINTKLEATAKEVAANSAREFEDRQWRKNNFVIFKLKESESEDAETRKVEDTEHVKKICQILEVNPDIKNAIRLGKKTPGNNRPLRVTLGNGNEVTELIKQTRKLEKLEDPDHIAYKRIVIKNDQTPLERDERKKLLAIRDQKREESRQKKDGIHWVIRGNRVVKNDKPPEGETQP